MDARALIPACAGRWLIRRAIQGRSRFWTTVKLELERCFGDDYNWTLKVLYLTDRSYRRECQDHTARVARMSARWGKPEPVDCEAALRDLGITDAVPRDVVAHRYASAEAARAFAESNRARHGHESLRIAETSSGIIGVTRLNWSARSAA